MQKIKDFLKANWIIIVLSVVASAFYLKANKHKPENTDESADDSLNSNGVTSPTAKDHYKNIALNLAHHLGTKYDWYDPRRWTENDQKVYDILKNITRNDFRIVSKLYFEVYAKGRNLSADLASMLDQKLYEKLTVK